MATCGVVWYAKCTAKYYGLQKEGDLCGVKCCQKASISVLDGVVLPWVQVKEILWRSDTWCWGRGSMQLCIGRMKTIHMELNNGYSFILKLCLTVWISHLLMERKSFTSLFFLVAAALKTSCPSSCWLTNSVCMYLLLWRHFTDALFEEIRAFKLKNFSTIWCHWTVWQ